MILHFDILTVECPMKIALLVPCSVYIQFLNQVITPSILRVITAHHFKYAVPNTKF